MRAVPAPSIWLAALFALFVLFLYGPMITIVLLSFQGPDGGLTFPMNAASSHWFSKLWNDGLPNVDIWSAFARSAWLGLVVMVLTVMLSLLAGLAYRRHFFGSDVLFFVVIASLIRPSIVVALGIGLEFRLIDDAVKKYAPAGLADGYDTAMGLFTSALGAHLTWTLPFGLLIMFAIFNRFDPRYEEAARVILARRPGRHCVTWCCRSSVPAWSASACSDSPCLGMKSRAPAKPLVTLTPCR